MLRWEERPVELANLLNPAFCALLLRDAAAGYRAQTERNLPYPLAFLVLPVSLHRATREALPRGLTAVLHAWIQEHPAFQLEMANRVRRLLPYTREAIIFGLQHGALVIDNDGGLGSAMKRAANPFPDDTEAAACRRAAIFIGRWFGRVGDASLILAMWGLRP